MIRRPPLLSRFADVPAWLARCPVTWCVGVSFLAWLGFK